MPNIEDVAHLLRDREVIKLRAELKYLKAQLEEKDRHLRRHVVSRQYRIEFINELREALPTIMTASNLANLDAFEATFLDECDECAQIANLIS